jgi:hypothetical protein
MRKPLKTLFSAAAVSALMVTAVAVPHANAYWTWSHHHRVWVQPLPYAYYAPRHPQCRYTYSVGGKHYYSCHY